MINSQTFQEKKHSNASLHQFLLEQWIFSIFSRSQPKDKPTPTTAERREETYTGNILTSAKYSSLCSDNILTWWPLKNNPFQHLTWVKESLQDKKPAHPWSEDLYCSNHSFLLHYLLMWRDWDNTSLTGQIHMAMPFEIPLASLPVSIQRFPLLAAYIANK